MTRSTQHSTLESCVRAVWRRTQRKHLATGLLALCRWGIPLFFLGMLIDRYAYLPTFGRAVVLLVILGVSFYQAWRHGWRKLRSFDSTRTAMMIEDQQGGLDSLLTTAIEFSKTGASSGSSQSLCDATIKKAEEAAVGLKPEKIVSFGILRIPARIAMALGVVVLLFAVLKGPFLAAGLARIFTPWVTVAYPTKTKLDLGEADFVVKEGGSARILIGVSGEVPETATLLLQTGDGSPRELDLAIEKGKAEYKIESASRNFSYRIKAGDTRSEWHQVRVIAAPRIKNVEVDLEFPAYLERENEKVEALTLTVPEDTKIYWDLELDQPIRQAVLHRDGQDPLELKVGDDGRRLVLDEEVDASRGYSFAWVEKEHGFEFTSPRYYLQVASDQAPRVELISPESNLDAMLGRPLELAVRAQDDHGIGTTTITYRVNRRPEKTINLPTPVLGGEGSQKLDWDYREELPDLQIGDSVSFVVEVADKYPGEGGPHLARTDSRRITFLSREEYLEEINKQMERLLTRVRTLYRQERAAHELTLGLDPAVDSYLPTCQLEAIRQEMVREQLVSTADQVQALLDDLAANKVSDAVESDVLASLQNSLRVIATEDVARAADLLRTQVGAETRDPQAAIAAVNNAARELAVLVMQRGIDASREVFARETHMLARELARLRLELLTAGPDQAEALAKEHEEVALWTEALLDNLSAHMRYDTRPLFVLGLNRRIHGLRTSGLVDSIREAAKLSSEGKMDEAAMAQYPLIRPLLESEFTMRSGSEYAQLRDLRDQLTAVIASQKALLADSQKTESLGEKADELAARQAQLREDLVLSALPTIPAPRPTLFDHEFLPVPPSDERRLEAEAMMAKALAGFEAKSKDDAVQGQVEALAALDDLDAMLDVWSKELAQKALGVSADVSDATNRVGVLEQFETMQIGLLEKTEEAALDEKNPKELLEEQQALAREIEIFSKELAGEGENPSKAVLPLIGRLDSVSKAMNQSTEALKAQKGEEALEPQEEAATALGEACELAEGQLSRLNMIQQLIGFKQAVGKASDGMADVVGGQNDLIAATEEADEEALEALLDPQKNLLNCLTDIAPSLDLVASRLDVGTPLVFAASDVEDALLAMEDGDAEDAAEIQQIAVESLTKVEGLVGEIAVQTGYVAEIVEFLSGAQSDAAMFAFRQRELREADKPEDALAQQQALASKADDYGRLLTEVAGNVDFEKLDEKTKERLEGLDLSLNFRAPAANMKEAVELMKSGENASDAMESAEKALLANSEQMGVIISMLNGLPSTIVTNAEPPELHRLIDILDVASKHRVLLRETQSAADKDLPAIAAAQQMLVEELAKFREGESADADLAAAHDQMQPASSALEASQKEEAAKAQLESDRTLRHFIIQWALVLNTATPPASSSDSDVLTESETDDLYETDVSAFVADFVSGEGPKDKESEWEILGERNRAALNQNFARELPLEYRATLKNYYERVAK